MLVGVRFLHPILIWLSDLAFPLREDELIVRGLSGEVLTNLVDPQLLEGSDLLVTTLLPFHDPRVRALMHEAKYHGNRKAFEFLGEVLGEYLLEVGNEEAFSKMILIPIPLSRARLRARGYNQVEKIVHSAIRQLGNGSRVELRTDVLMRIRDTATQTSLSRSKRKENLRNAFRVPEILDASSTYIVIDDVVTTGATLKAAAIALDLAGAQHIILLAIAH